jgi:hypothetical protein
VAHLPHPSRVSGPFHGSGLTFVHQRRGEAKADWGKSAASSPTLIEVAFTGTFCGAAHLSDFGRTKAERHGLQDDHGDRLGPLDFRLHRRRLTPAGVRVVTPVERKISLVRVSGNLHVERATILGFDVQSIASSGRP